MDYRAILPDDTFLADYMDYNAVQETSSAYDFWCGMWLLGNACGRSAFVDRPRAPVYLNWYVILVAESGITRKSTAVRIARQLASSTSDRLAAPFDLLQSKVTPEMLETKMHYLTKEHGYAHVAVAVSELVTVLGRERYTQTMPGLLTDLYDCDDHRVGGGTMGGGVRDARNVFVSLLSASTPTWLRRAVNPDVVEGGFTSRTLFVVSEQPKRRIAWPEEVSDDNVRERLAQYLGRCRVDSTRYGGIALSDGGMRDFTSWYKRRKLSTDSFRGSFESREDAHVLRTAACLAVNDRTWIIQSRHVTAAIRLIGEVKERSAELFDRSLDHGKYINAIDRLRTLLVSAGMEGLAQKRITVSMQHMLNAKDTTTLLEIMLELGAVQKFEGVRQGPGRPKTVWRATRKMTEGSIIEQVMQEIEPA